MLCESRNAALSFVHRWNKQDLERPPLVVAGETGAKGQ